MKRTAAIFGFLAVVLGALGAHGALVHDRVVANGRLAQWETAAHYHLAHAIVLLVLAWAASGAVAAYRLFVAGIVIFSGSLYLLALTNFGKLGMITPIGGLCLMGGWIWLAVRGGKS